jgi:hypothetical protein
MGDRLLRAGIRKSERTEKLVKIGGWFAGLFYTWLITVVDDYGRYHAHPKILRADVFPFLLDEVTEEMVADAVKACVDAGLIVHYEVKRQWYLELLDFNQRLRAHNSKFPAPPSAGPLFGECQGNVMTLSGQCSDKDTSMHSDTDTDTYKYKKRRGHSPDNVTTESEQFANFMRAWPEHFRKPVPSTKARLKVYNLWRQRGYDQQPELIMRGLARWKTSRQWAADRGAFIPGPYPWLFDRKFEVEPPQATEAAAESTGFQRVYSDDVVDGVLAKLGKGNGKTKAKPTDA